MKRSIELMAVVAVLLLCGFVTSTPAQVLPSASVAPPRIKSGAGTVFIPASSQAKPGDAGVRAHTNFGILIPETTPTPDEAPPYSGYAFETPASIACVYQLVTVTPGCNPNVVTATPTGGSNTIAVVDAYDDPWAGPDLAYFSAQFGIPFSPAQFQVVYATGVQPGEDPTGNWEFEAAADIEYAHALAPKATIYLVEAASESMSDLLTAVKVASSLIQCGQTNCPSGGTGTGEVIMSGEATSSPVKRPMTGPSPRLASSTLARPAIPLWSYGPVLLRMWCASVAPAPPATSRQATLCTRSPGTRAAAA